MKRIIKKPYTNIMSAVPKSMYAKETLYFVAPSGVDASLAKKETAKHQVEERMCYRCHQIKPRRNKYCYDCSYDMTKEKKQRPSFA